MISYYLGILFYIFSDLTNDNEKVANNFDLEGNPQNFIEYFGL
jgi:hypothetical protein